MMRSINCNHKVRFLDEGKGVCRGVRDTIHVHQIARQRINCDAWPVSNTYESMKLRNNKS